MLKLSVGDVRFEHTGTPPLPITYSLKCAVGVTYQGSILTYDSIRLDHFLSEVVATYLAISFSMETTRLYFDGYEAYALFEERDPISLTFSDVEFPANVTYFDFLQFRQFTLDLIQQMQAGLRQLDLPREKLLEIRRLFRYSGFLIPSYELP